MHYWFKKGFIPVDSDVFSGDGNPWLISLLEGLYLDPYAWLSIFLSSSVLLVHRVIGM